MKARDPAVAARRMVRLVLDTLEELYVVNDTRPARGELPDAPPG